VLRCLEIRLWVASNTKFGAKVVDLATSDGGREKQLRDVIDGAMRVARTLLLGTTSLVY